MISTPVASASMSQPVTPQSSHNREQSTPSARALVENPLVRVGLVPQHLVDIFVTACAHELNEKPSSRCITGVRVLTSNEYVEMMKQKDIKEKETAEMKQKRKEEREQRRVEKEQEQSRKRKEREEKKGKGKKHRRQSSSEDEHPDVDDEDRSHFQSSSPSRYIRVPDRYRTGVVLKVTQYALYAMLGSPQSLTRWYFGLTVTSVGSGLIHTAVWAATLHPSSLFAYHVLRNNYEL